MGIQIFYKGRLKRLAAILISAVFVSQFNVVSYGAQADHADEQDPSVSGPVIHFTVPPKPAEPEPEAPAEEPAPAVPFHNKELQATPTYAPIQTPIFNPVPVVTAIPTPVPTAEPYTEQAEEQNTNPFVNPTPAPVARPTMIPVINPETLPGNKPEEKSSKAPVSGKASDSNDQNLKYKEKEDELKEMGMPETLRNQVLNNFLNASVKSISFKDSLITIMQGEKVKPEIIVEPDTATEVLEWESDDEGIVRFDEEGLAEGINPGETTVTVRSKSGASATCNIKCTASESTESKKDVQSEVRNETEGSDRIEDDDSDNKKSGTLSSNSLSANKPEERSLSAGEIYADSPENGEITADKAVTITNMRFKDNGEAFTVIINQSYAPQLIINNDASIKVSSDMGLTWSISPSSYATVDSNGNVTGRTAGSATLTVRAPNGVTATCKLTIKAPAPETLSLFLNNRIELYVGESKPINPTISPSGVAEEAKIVDFSIADSSIASLSPAKGKTTTITGVKVGTTTINAKLTNYPLITARPCTVIVKERISVTGVTVDPTRLDINVGEYANITATVAPPKASDTSVTWKSSDSSTARVSSGASSSTCWVYGVKEGGPVDFTVTTGDGSKTATCKVYVHSVPVTGIRITNPSSGEMEVTEGTSKGLTAELTPDNATNKNVTWTSSDVNVATVLPATTSSASPTVSVYGKKAQDTPITITATTEDGHHIATCKVTVVSPVSVSEVAVKPKNLTLTVGEAAQKVTGTVTPTDATNQLFKWELVNSADEPDDTISQITSPSSATGAGSAYCYVKGLKKGSVRLKATSLDNENLYDYCEITVVPKPLEITLDKSELTLEEGESDTLTATVTPATETYKEIKWTINPEIASLSANGNSCTITSSGVDTSNTATITATVVSNDDDEYSATCTLTVNKKPVPVTGLVVEPASITIKPGEAFNLSWHTLPEGADETTVTLKSNNTEIATVEPETGSGTGSASVTGGNVDATRETDIVVTTAEGHSATCHVTVERIRVTDVYLSINEIDLYEGESQQLEATVLPENAEDKSLSWNSASPSTAYVDQSGLVTGVKEGTTVVTVHANDGGKRDVCIVHVHKRGIDADGILLTPEEITINIGQDFDLTATLIPDNATDKKITWKTNNPTVVTVSGNGLKANAVGKAAGTAVITATTSNGKTAFCIVTVEDIIRTIYVEDVYLDQMFKTIYVGESFDLTPTVVPSDAYDRTVTWKSSNESIATVKNGRVTGLKKGTATITVTTNGLTVNGERRTATCEVTVKEEPKPVAGPYKLYIVDDRTNAYRPDKVRGTVEALAGDRYLVIRDSSGSTIKPLIKGDSSLSYTKALFYDMWIVDIGGYLKNDFIKCTVRIPLPTDMDIHKGTVRVVSIQDGRLDKSISSSVGEDDGVGYVSFTATHFTEYAILYKKNSSPKAETRVIYRDVPVIQYRDVEKNTSKPATNTQPVYTSPAAPAMQTPSANVRILDNVPRTGDR